MKVFSFLGVLWSLIRAVCGAVGHEFMMNGESESLATSIGARLRESLYHDSFRAARAILLNSRSKSCGLGVTSVCILLFGSGLLFASEATAQGTIPGSGGWLMQRGSGDCYISSSPVSPNFQSSVITVYGPAPSYTLLDGPYTVNMGEHLDGGWNPVNGGPLTLTDGTYTWEVHVAGANSTSMNATLNVAGAVMIGMNGDDVICGSDSRDWIFGQLGDDQVSGENGNDILLGGSGEDLLWGDEAGSGVGEVLDGHDLIYGGSEDDTIYGAGQWNTLVGEGGTDTIYGGLHWDGIWGDDLGGPTTGTGDFLYGGEGDDYIRGCGGNDYIEGNDGMDDLFGDIENDEIHGNDGDDFIRGGDGEDILFGWLGNDALDGGDDPDDLYGYSGGTYGDPDEDLIDFDFLYDNDGFAGDRLYGENADDLLWSKDLLATTPADSLDGGSGYDTYWHDASYDSITNVESVGSGTGPGTSFLTPADPFLDYAKWPTPDANDFWHSSGHAGTRSS